MASARQEKEAAILLCRKKLSEGTITVPVPDHNEIKIGTLQSIIRTAQNKKGDLIMKKLSLIIIFVFILMATAQATKKQSDYIDRSGITIFKRGAKLKPPDKIKVDKVIVVQETNYSLVLDVFYTYNDDVPNEEVKLFALPDTPYWASNPISVGKGSKVGRVSIDLYEKKMEEDQVDQYESSKLTISFDHYSPEKFIGSIYRQIIPFKKIWKTRK